MGTLVGVGSSSSRNPEEAGREAARQALEQKGPGKPDMVFVFATVGYNQQTLIRAIREITSGAPLSGCSGEGIITQGVVAETNFAVCVMAISSDDLRFQNFCIKELGHGLEAAGEHLASNLNPVIGEDSIACFLFADGLIFDFDPFRAGLEKMLKIKGLKLFGGLAADNWAITRTFQYHDEEVFSEGVSCVLMSGHGGVTWGISHGCVPIGTKRTITRSKGNIIYEIDQVPALEALKEYSDNDWHTEWNKLSLNLCLGFKTPEYLRQDYDEFIVRYMVKKDDAEGCVTIQSDVTAGTDFWMVRRDKELIREGLQTISRQIKGRCGACHPKFVLHFECMGRGKVVFREQEKEALIWSLQKDIGREIPWIGFYTYGEIGPVAGFNCIHNFTAVVAAVY